MKAQHKKWIKELFRVYYAGQDLSIVTDYNVEVLLNYTNFIKKWIYFAGYTDLLIKDNIQDKHIDLFTSLLGSELEWKSYTYKNTVFSYVVSLLPVDTHKNIMCIESVQNLNSLDSSLLRKIKIDGILYGK